MRRIYMQSFLCWMQMPLQHVDNTFFTAQKVTAYGVGGGKLLRGLHVQLKDHPSDNYKENSFGFHEVFSIFGTWHMYAPMSKLEYFTKHNIIDSLCLSFILRLSGPSLNTYSNWYFVLKPLLLWPTLTCELHRLSAHLIPFSHLVTCTLAACQL